MNNKNFKNAVNVRVINQLTKPEDHLLSVKDDVIMAATSEFMISIPDPNTYPEKQYELKIVDDFKTIIINEAVMITLKKGESIQLKSINTKSILQEMFPKTKVAPRYVWNVEINKLKK